MKYMSFDQSEVLREYARIMQEKDGLTKIAQAVVPLTEDEKTKLHNFLAELVKAPANGPGMERWMMRLKGTQDPYFKSVHDALAQRYSLWAQGKDSTEISTVPLPTQSQPDNMAEQPVPSSPVASAPGPVRAALSQRAKTAEQKCYEVTLKEDMIQKAHPVPAKTCGDELVENKNEQQEADLAVAEKSAQIVKALYKLAKRLRVEKNDEAYKLVKDACLEIAKTIKR
jgi:hypothetical protein